MKSNYQKLIALGLLYLISTQSKAQETSSFTITPELSKQIIEKQRLNVGVFPVSKKEIEYHTADTSATTKRYYKYALDGVKEYEKFKDADKSFQQHQYQDYLQQLEQQKQKIAEELKSDVIQKRMAFILDDRSIDINRLSGEYIELPKKYMVAIKAIENKFVKNELSDDLRDNYNVNYETLSRSYPLIQKVGTDEYYFIMSDDYISSITSGQRITELLNTVQKLGYKEYQHDGNTYIKSKTSEIRLDARTYNEFKRNPSYITALDNDQIKIAGLVKQTIPLSTSLNKYLSTYNVKRSKMSSIDLANWRNTTSQAIKLNQQIISINEKYDGNYSFTLLNKSNALGTFAENLLASKGVLGM